MKFEGAFLTVKGVSFLSMRRIKYGFVMLCGILLSATVLASDWPAFMGPEGTGISTEKGINKNWDAKPPKVLWQTNMSDNGYAGPAVADGKVFIIDRGANMDRVRAIDLETGKDLWEFAYPETSRQDYGYARTTPTYDQGKLYTLSKGGLLHCLDAQNGKALWSLSFVNDLNGILYNWEVASSPVVDGEKLIVFPGGQKNVAALDKNTGKVIWQGGNSDRAGYATAVIATINGVKQYIMFTARNVMGVNADNGNVLWQYPWVTDYDVNAANPLVIGDNQVFVTSSYYKGCAMLRIEADWKVTQLWENDHIQSEFSSPVYYGGYIYGTTDPAPGALVCLDPQNGQIKWRQRAYERGGLIAVDGVIIAMYGWNGNVVMVKADPSSYQELGRLNKPLGGQSWTPPVLSHGRLLIRNRTSLACIDLR